MPRQGNIVMSMLACGVFCLSVVLSNLPVSAQIDTSNATFNEAVQAVKDRNFQHAVRLFSLQANNNQHDAQYNLALLMHAGAHLVMGRAAWRN
jgi:hypothetical protein